MITISQFIAKINPKLHGTTSNKTPGIYARLAEAAGNVLARIDPYTTKRRARIENAIYDKVYNYTAPDDIKGVSKIIDIRPIGERSTTDNIEGRFSKEFDIKKEKDTLQIEYVNGVKTLRLSKKLTSRTILHNCDNTTLEGTITASGDASGLDMDYLDHVSGSASLKFTLSGATGQGILTFALNSAKNLDTLEQLGAVFNWLKFPLASALTSVTMRIGSDSSNYYEKTVTTAHDRAFESDAWMLLRYIQSTATKVGTPDFENIDYLQLTINYTPGTAREVKIDNITASLGEAWEVIYYSNCLFKNTAGTTYKDIPTADSDIILLENTDINLLLYEYMILTAQEQKGKDGTSDVVFYRLKLYGRNTTKVFDDDDPGLYELYEQQYPSEALVTQETYYNFGDGDYNYDELDSR
jgi:hypothetical protein